jgi:8-oxo-dGTP pyrophosphatase MutT (NUDIX family)
MSQSDTQTTSITTTTTTPTTNMSTSPKNRSGGEYVGAGFILLTRDLQVLLVKDANSDKWGFPKGHRESYDASDLATAQRELLEETGIQPSEYTAVHVPFRIMRGSSSYIFRYAVLKTTGPVILAPTPTQPHEVSELRWVSLVDMCVDPDCFAARLGNKYLRTWIEDVRDAGSDVAGSKKSVSLLLDIIQELMGAAEARFLSHFKNPCVRVTS